MQFGVDVFTEASGFVKRWHPKRKVVCLASIFSGEHVSFRDGNPSYQLWEDFPRQGCGLPGLRRHRGPRVIQQFFFISTAQDAERVDEESFMSGIERLHKMFLYLEGV